MGWLFELNAGYPVAHALGILALVCMAGGMALGSVHAGGMGLGTSEVLFAGILVGHFGKPIAPGTLAFVKEFGLTLFVFAIRLQLGPGFFATLRQQGVRMKRDDPPALTFASNLAGSDAPAVAYATVYRLTMLLRILCAQVLTLTLIR